MIDYDLIDIDRLRADMESEALGAYLGGGFGAALIEATDIQSISDDELIEIAQARGIDIEKYTG